jgi:hypothetical protein
LDYNSDYGVSYGTVWSELLIALLKEWSNPHSSMFSSLLDPEDGGSRILQNIGTHPGRRYRQMVASLTCQWVFCSVIFAVKDSLIAGMFHPV